MFGNEVKPVFQQLVMAVKYGTMGEFNSDQEDWVSYTELFTQYFIANDITEEGDKCRAIYYSVPVVLLHTNLFKIW